jgi:hypothetical protein
MADQYAIIPAQGDPFAPNIGVVPSNGDPFAAFPANYAGTPTPHDFTPDAPASVPQHQWTADDLVSEWQRQRREEGAQGLSDIATDLRQKFVDPVVSAATAPGDIMAGKLTPDDPRFADSAIGAAALATTASLPFAEEGALGSGGGKILAYHGSPHDFDQFDMSKIGTGEGAQAYGHGLYFAENEGVAKSYRDALSNRTAVGPEFHANSALAQYGDRDRAAQALLDRVDLTDHPAAKQSYQDAADLIKNGWTPNVGHMYQVSINADPERFLDWDAPLSEQSPHVQNVLGKIGYFGEGRLSSEGYRKLGSDYGGPDMAASMLSNAGIPGIKYLDAGSRAAGSGSRNYVVFDDKTVDILKKYGLAGVGLGGASIVGALQNQGQPNAP